MICRSRRLNRSSAFLAMSASSANKLADAKFLAYRRQVPRFDAKVSGLEGNETGLLYSPPRENNVIPPKMGGRDVKDSATPRPLFRSVRKSSRNPSRQAARFWWLVLPALAGVVALLPPMIHRADAAPASTFTVLHSFSQTAQLPYAALLLDGSGNVYGTSSGGGFF